MLRPEPPDTDTCRNDHRCHIGVWRWEKRGQRNQDHQENDRDKIYYKHLPEFFKKIHHTLQQSANEHAAFAMAWNDCSLFQCPTFGANAADISSEVVAAFGTFARVSLATGRGSKVPVGAEQSDQSARHFVPPLIGTILAMKWGRQEKHQTENDKTYRHSLPEGNSLDLQRDSE